MESAVAANTGKGFRRGSVRERSQVVNPVTRQFAKRDLTTGQFMAAKDSPFKGVALEPDHRKD
jgi:hypothetical protein